MAAWWWRGREREREEKEKEGEPDEETQKEGMGGHRGLDLEHAPGTRRARKERRNEEEEGGIVSGVDGPFLFSIGVPVYSQHYQPYPQKSRHSCKERLHNSGKWRGRQKRDVHGVQTCTHTRARTHTHTHTHEIAPLRRRDRQQGRKCV